MNQQEKSEASKFLFQCAVGGMFLIMFLITSFQQNSLTPAQKRADTDFIMNGFRDPKTQQMQQLRDEVNRQQNAEAAWRLRHPYNDPSMNGK